MATLSASHWAVTDDLLPEESASSVSGVTITNTQHVSSSRWAAAAIKYRIMQQQLELYKFIAKLEDKYKLAELERVQQEMERACIEEKQSLALARDLHTKI